MRSRLRRMEGSPGAVCKRKVVDNPARARPLAASFLIVADFAGHQSKRPARPPARLCRQPSWPTSLLFNVNALAQQNPHAIVPPRLGGVRTARCQRSCLKPVRAAFAQALCKPPGRFQTYPTTFHHRGRMTKAA